MIIINDHNDSMICHPTSWDNEGYRKANPLLQDSLKVC